MLKIDTDKMIRIGDVVINLSHVRCIRFFCRNSEGGIRRDIQAHVSLVGEKVPLGFEGRAARELYLWCGGDWED
jgi:hypothetical protein